MTRARTASALAPIAAVVLALAPVAAAQAAPTLTASSYLSDGSTRASGQLAGGASPSGEVAFALYGPGDAQCGGTPVFSSTATVSGNGTYTSGLFSPQHAGVHRWVARYGGDAGNSAAQSACGAQAATVTVPKARRALALAPSAGVVVGRPLHAVATLSAPADACPQVTRLQGWGCLARPSAAASAGFAPAGTIAFRLYGPDDPTCARSPAFTDEVAVAQAGAHSSAPLTPTRAGVYRWSATFSGDADNEAAAAACGAEVAVAKATPTLSAAASPGVAVGGSIDATGTLAGGYEIGGKLAVAAYGPGDERCVQTPVFSSAVDAAGDGAYRSASFRPAHAGTYRWVLSHPGDANNEAIATRCDSASAAVTVTPAGSPPARAPTPPPPPASRPVREPAIERLALAARCVRPAANGSVRVVLRLRTARAGAVRVRVERALGTAGRERCPAAGGSGRFDGRYRTVARLREVRTQAAAAALARRLTLRLRLRPALYRITVRAYTSSGRLSPPKRRYLRVLTDTTGTR